jgi:PAS domain S-box-containing protein
VTSSLVIALAAALIATGAAAAILAQDARQTVNRLAALLIGGVAWWGVCDVGRVTAPDAEWALFFARASAPGWSFVGPLALHLLAMLQVPRPRPAVRVLPFSYAAGAGFVAVSFLSPWMYGSAEPAGPGWHVPPGPAVLLVLAFTMAHVLPVMALGISLLRRSPSPSDRAQVLWVAVGIALPVVCIPITNVLLPLFDRPTLRLGSLSFALFGAVIAWTAHRHGYSPLARGGFARQILDAHPDGVALVLLNGIVGSASAGLTRLVGAPAAALEGRSIAELLDQPLAEPPREVQELEAALRLADGQAIPASVSTRILQDRKGLDFALVVVIRDLREVVALRSRLVTSGRLAAMGQLAAGIAHEINNPMAFVRTNLSLLRNHWERLAKDPVSKEERNQLFGEGDELLAESLEGVERTSAIVRDINSFAHAGTGERTSVDLHALLENVLRVATPHLGAGITVQRDFGDVPPAFGGAQELKQVFLNLILNAAQAMGGAGTIRITARTEDDRVVVRVQDDGCGIPPESMEKIFDPFFTTKPVGEGTGMGLFISYEIVRNHGGEIRVESAPGTGTAVSVRLPTGNDD